MRRILLGGLGLALGVFTPPALAQQPVSTSPPTRAASFGRPTAIPDTPATAPGDSSVTPAGLFRNGPSRPAVNYTPGYAPGYPPGTPGVPVTQGAFGTPTPILAAPPDMGGIVPTPMPMTPGTGTPLTAPRPVPGAPPTVTETRDPTGRIPMGTVVPSVTPDGSYVCPEPGLEDPLCPGGGVVGIDRLRGCGRNWVTAELLLWWNRSTQVPPLVTTSSPVYNGIIGQGDTQTLLGGSFGSTYHTGGRVGGGHWFDDNECRGFDWRFFWVAPATSTFTASTPPYPLLARPFYNVNPGLVIDPALVLTPGGGYGPLAEVIAGPGVATGAVSVNMKSTVWGAEANYRRYLAGRGNARLDLLLGYRYLDLREQLDITESFTRIPGTNFGPNFPVSGVISDQFRTENHFHGGQIGLAGTLERGRWSVNTRATVALGSVFQSADINGSQALLLPNGMVSTTAGGLLAVPGANIGHWTQTKFAVVPEVGVNLGYQVTSRLKVFVGYNFLYLSSAVRPGEVIDPGVDVARIPNFLTPGSVAPVNPPRPTPHLSTSGYFIQGISFGLVYRW